MGEPNPRRGQQQSKPAAREARRVAGRAPRAEAENQARPPRVGPPPTAGWNTLLAQPPETALVLTTPIDAGLVVRRRRCRARGPADCASFDRGSRSSAPDRPRAALRAPDLTPKPPSRAAPSRSSAPAGARASRCRAALHPPRVRGARRRSRAGALDADARPRCRIAGDIAAARGHGGSAQRRHTALPTS